ncbi:HTH-type transcriptional regulator/antitoxin HigA|uniref:HTH-type transcriptional regulator/antitoxin HigA n=1 Tax=Brenneria salicis ATCC 15712 = DSM 30166 TaxID=714314 RepID=A0A366I156_9GAMM|nr:helix-turn-helix domain-containing protein [Brenneria salicis]NMN92123.1 HTH-type transcriptional regulator/antitoxin HigA [Brenneria salicis ATCC 15712 = DSM 30166]RBP61113.1 HTH-type transcriptional regulator/antitoxin HigA [Brenneria salicis ATCC 15712 = DSM 30166]RLM29809.1 transcriptional regulator [Brenneria salicis ATCC 15712 = DSM 30166]
MIADVIEATKTLERAFPLLSGSKEEHDYEDALNAVEELIENEGSDLLISLLSAKIAEYERQSECFSAFNAALDALPKGVAALRVLMNQHGLKLSDLKDEIGVKSLVSQILNGKRSLTVDHIRALSARFNVSPSLFI